MGLLPMTSALTLAGIQVTAPTTPGRCSVSPTVHTLAVGLVGVVAVRVQWEGGSDECVTEAYS